MVHRSQALIVFTAFLTACTPAPEYPPPAQKQMPVGSDPLPSATFIQMSDTAADMGIVQEILPVEPGSSWRWTNQHPKVKVWVNDVDGWRLHVKFTMPAVVLRQTGPVTIQFAINDQVLGAETFGQDKLYEYVKDVPSEILRPGDPNVIALDLDRVYVSPKDGVKLGILLQEIGVKRAGGS